MSPFALAYLSENEEAGDRDSAPIKIDELLGINNMHNEQGPP
jgi:hypothetical protein